MEATSLSAVPHLELSTSPLPAVQRRINEGGGFGADVGGGGEGFGAGAAQAFHRAEMGHFCGDGAAFPRHSPQEAD